MRVQDKLVITALASAVGMILTVFWLACQLNRALKDDVRIYFGPPKEFELHHEKGNSK